MLVSRMFSLEVFMTATALNPEAPGEAIPDTTRASLWSATVPIPAAPPQSLDADETADVCVIGGGIAGLTTAYHLLEAGLSVVLLEDGGLGAGMTCRTSAHLSCVLDDRFSELERLRGPQAARMAAASHAAAIDRIEMIAAREGIECGFERVDAFLFAGTRGQADKRARELETEFLAATRAGLIVERLPRSPVPGFDGPCLRFPGQAQFHPLHYIAGLADAVAARGGRIRHAHATAVEPGRKDSKGRKNGNGGRARVRAGNHTVSAAHVVVATNSPVNNLVALHLKLAAHITYVIAVRVPHGSVPRGLYWDNEDPYHYVRLAPDPLEPDAWDVLIVGGEDHRTGAPPRAHAPHAALEAWTRARIPDAGEVIARWGGQVMETIDGLAYIGRNPMDHDNIYVVAGDSGMGLTHGTVAGMVLTDLITGRANPWIELYDPARKPLKAAVEFVPDAAHAMARYADWVTPGDVKNVEAIGNDEGAVVRSGLTKKAVYRDRNGIVHACSAVCPHLGGIVTWNSAEHTWDCPCHGSRFDPWGHVLCGPSNRNLDPA